MPGTPQVTPSRQLNPISTNNITINHEAQCKKHIALIRQEGPLTHTLNIDTFLQDSWRPQVSQQRSVENRELINRLQ
jgi:hypothetical protein